jgi:hypothetical protein
VACVVEAGTAVAEGVCDEKVAASQDAKRVVDTLRRDRCADHFGDRALVLSFTRRLGDDWRTLTFPVALEPAHKAMILSGVN